MSNILVNAPKTARRGEVVEIKALILHPMETGFRPGPNGRIIRATSSSASPRPGTAPRSSRWRCRPRSRPTRSSPFFAQARESGTVVLRWTGDEGFAAEERVAIAVE